MFIKKAKKRNETFKIQTINDEGKNDHPAMVGRYPRSDGNGSALGRTISTTDWSNTCIGTYWTW
jgi:hypothetical protein